MATKGAVTPVASIGTTPGVRLPRAASSPASMRVETTSGATTPMTTTSTTMTTAAVTST